MMRLSQDKKYQETIESTATEQVDNKFEFYKKKKTVAILIKACIFYTTIPI
jgi:hypothetical protein